MLSRIWDSRWVAIDYDPRDGGDDLLITFTSLSPTGTNTKGLWVSGTEKLRIPTLFFIAKANHWFSTPDMPGAVEVARNIRGQYQKATLIGPSMGGHAAIRFSKRLNASAVVAISPQLCIRPEVVGNWDTRFASEYHLIEKMEPLISQDSVAGKVYVPYDDHYRVDARHVQLLMERISLTTMPLPHSGHSSARAILDMGLLGSFFDLKGDDADLEKVKKIFTHYHARAPRTATVILETARNLRGEHKKAYLSGIGDYIGFPDHKAAVAKLIETTVGAK
jgi:hypothetical protein